MGPSLIFDKSTLQSLNIDEAFWLDNFFNNNITPLFFIETLADLEKEVRSGKTPEQVVGTLAYKTPESSCSNVHHRRLLEGELMGYNFGFGRPIISGCKAVALNGETGIIFNEPKEVEALKRWRNHEFLDVERCIAKRWRKDLSNQNNIMNYQIFDNMLSIYGDPKSLGDARSIIYQVIEGNNQEEVLYLGLLAINASDAFVEDIFNRWVKGEYKSIKEFAPYFYHILSVEMFFYLSNRFGLLSQFPHPETQHIDLAYFYYLPFCDVFVSNDRFHLGLAPFFSGPDQSIIKGQELKEDLLKLNNFYLQLPEEIKERGIITFACHPPLDEAFLITKLWDKHMSESWRKMESYKFDGSDKRDLEREKILKDKISNFEKESKPIDYKAIGNSDNANNFIVKRKVLARKGSWRRFPKEVEDANLSSN